MKVLVVGSGGREHAIVWKLSLSPKVNKIYALPGNGGMERIAQCVSGIAVDDVNAIADFAQENKIDLTVVGPELPLTVGLVDEMEKRGLRVFGPSAAAARIEGSKSFAKAVMDNADVPTARAGVFERRKEALAYLENCSLPIVVKADGLAAGKGVIIAEDMDAAREAVTTFLSGRKFGKAGARVVIEDFLVGDEASYFVVSDGENFVRFGSSQDHKRAFDGDEGPNTGGMGAYSPAFMIDSEKNSAAIDSGVIAPTLKAMRDEGCPYRGFLYAGLIMTKDGPQVLEYNARMGDPESQVVFVRLKTDLVDVIEAALDGWLDRLEIEWDSRPAITVVIASGGYPGEYKKGFVISGLDEAEKIDDVHVFHAGTQMKGGRFYSSGGRVLAVTALGDDFTDAVRKAYDALGRVSFENCFSRKDIGFKALKYVSNGKAGNDTGGKKTN